MPLPNLPQIDPVIPADLWLIAITMEDPTAPVAITGWRESERGFPSGEAVQQFFRDSGFTVASWKIVDYNDIPKDRTYRDAWVHTGKAFDHDMVKAREIHRTYLRTERLPALAALDVAAIRAEEAGVSPESARLKTDIASAKQVLRDLPADPAIEAAETVADLKALWPADL